MCLTFIVKQNIKYFPMQVLYKNLLVRHGSRSAGHLVAMQSKVANIELFEGVCLVTKGCYIHCEYKWEDCHE